MAYAFNRRGPQQPQKADIFSQPADGMGAVSSAQQPQQGGPQRAKELPGAVSSSTATASAPAAQAAPGTEESPQAGAVKAVRAASQQAGAFPGVFGQIQGDIATAERGLQDEANKYVSGARAYKAPTTEQMEEAIGGGDSSAVMEYLTPQAWATQGPEFTTDTQIEDVGRVQSDAGLREILSRGQGPGYTSGMSNFDVAALKKQAGYQDTMRELKGRQQALETSKAGLYDSSRAAREASERASYDAAAAQTRAYLDENLARISQGNQAQADATNAELAGGAQKFAQDRLAQARQDFIAQNPELAPYVNDIIKGGPESYYTTQDATADMYYDQGDLDRYRGISGLLGMGGELPTLGSGSGWQDLVNVNEQGYKDYVGGKAGTAKKMADKKAAQTAANKAAREEKKKQQAIEEAGAPIEFEDEKAYAKRFPKVDVPSPYPGIDIDPQIQDLGQQTTTIAKQQQPGGQIEFDQGQYGGGYAPDKAWEGETFKGIEGFLGDLEGIGQQGGDFAGSGMTSLTKPLVDPLVGLSKKLKDEKSGWGWK